MYLMDLFVSIVSIDFTHACVDARLPLGRDAQRWISIAGDTLAVLEQLVNASDRPVTIVRRYFLDQSTCVWFPTGIEPVAREEQ